MFPVVAIVRKLIESTPLPDILPPAKQPRIEFDAHPGLFRPPSAMSPKSVAFPNDAMVTKSTILVEFGSPGAVVPPANIALVDDESPPTSLLAAVKLPKVLESPFVAIVIN